MTSPGGSFGTGFTSMTSSWLLRNCTMSMRVCRALVTDVGPVDTSLAHHRNLWMGLPRTCQTVRVSPRISAKCRALRSPIRITGASTEFVELVKSVRPSMICMICRTRMAVCARSSGFLARCVETTTNSEPQARHLSSTIRQLRSRFSPPCSSAASTRSKACLSHRKNLERRQNTPHPSCETVRGRLWKTESHVSPRHCAKCSCWSSSTSDMTSASRATISFNKRCFLVAHLKSSSRRSTLSIASGDRMPCT
mmetsp:Transcript_23440/g.64909  ORF Transcript_23440/g.64909 Transcript_23440/m.64909 type:complete len:252 (+) Transcript_23440:965-1720(+)